jgi:hypothetical protein
MVAIGYNFALKGVDKIMQNVRSILLLINYFLTTDSPQLLKFNKRFKSFLMKKYSFAAMLILLSSFSLMAQQDHSSHQHTTPVSQPASADSSPVSQLLTSYYGIKDALVKSNAASASSAALEFVKTANAIDYKLISEGNINALVKDAAKISETKDINKQRQYFANLSENMFTVAKSVKLSNKPVYQAYCPMKKTYWLTNEKAIKNPYYGNTMLTCGSITATLE